MFLPDVDFLRLWLLCSFYVKERQIAQSPYQQHVETVPPAPGCLSQMKFLSSSCWLLQLTSKSTNKRPDSYFNNCSVTGSSG